MTASAARRPETMAQWIEERLWYSPQTNSQGADIRAMLDEPAQLSFFILSKYSILLPNLYPGI